MERSGVSAVDDSRLRRVALGRRALAIHDPSKRARVGTSAGAGPGRGNTGPTARAAISRRGRTPSA